MTFGVNPADFHFRSTLKKNNSAAEKENWSRIPLFLPKVSYSDYGSFSRKNVHVVSNDFHFCSPFFKKKEFCG
tara:strand:- start:1777 stop:1995 length:219 start_codon:yes stop_codon:yes gene_type:complete